MTWYNAALERFILPAGDLVMRTSFVERLRHWRDLQWLDSSDLERTQADALTRLLRHASQHVPYYRDRSIPEVRDPREWLRGFPVMMKPEVKANISRLVYGAPSRLIAESSSGSSGVQGTVYMSRHEQSTNRAIQVLWWEWAGYRLGEPVLQTGITPGRGLVKAAKDRLLRTDYRSAFNLDENQLSTIVDRLGSRPGTMLLGYASSLFLIAQAARAVGRADIRLRGVVSWGDKLFDHYRHAIEGTFGAAVHDTYACTEGFMMAAQCARLRYHIMSPQVYLELLDTNLKQEVPPGQPGHVVVTRLDGYAMPLIRYYLGDIAVREDPEADCECGRRLPLLRQVVGRDTDIVHTRSGKFLIVHFFTGIFEHVPEIRQFRVLQRSVDEMEIEYIPDHGFHPEVLLQVERRIHERLGEPFPVRFRAVDRILPTKSGKPQIVQSLMGVPA